MTELEWKMSEKESHVTSLISVSNYMFTLSIEISKLEHFIPLVSPKFYPASDQAFYAALTIGENRCGLTFYQQSGSVISVQHDISIMDCMDNVFWEGRLNHKYCSSFKSVYRGWKLPELRKFSNASKKKILIFKCSMELSKFLNECDLQKCHPKSVSPMDNLSALSDDLKAIYASSLHADVTINAEGSTVRVHKTLLCARSPVFAKMFETPMDESVKNTVDIPDLQLSVLKDMVAFLYTGTLSSDDFDSVYALYYAADKYDVTSLRNTCVDVLLSKMDVTNACRVLVLAEQHSNGELKKSAMDFIQFNFEEILATEVWDQFVVDETQLATEVILIYSKKYKNMKTK